MAIDRDTERDSGRDDSDSPVVPVLGRPLVRAEFWAVLLALAALVFGSLAAARAVGATTGDPWLIGAAALAQAGLAVHYARRPVGYARATLPVPVYWYQVAGVVAVGVAAGAVATFLLG